MLLHEGDETRAVILDELQSSRQWLLNELWAVASERGVSIVDVDPVALQRVFIRRVPEVCALMARTLLRVSQGDGELLIEAFGDHLWFRLPALAELAEALEAHWFECLPYLHNWAGWEPVWVDLSGLDLELQCFRNPVSGRLVADFVGLVAWPDEAAAAASEPVQAAYLRDAERVCEALESEWGWEFLALRCLTPGRDGVTVHWLHPDLTDGGELAALDALNP